MWFKRALRLDRSFLAAWTLMGHEYIELKNTAAAIGTRLRVCVCVRVCTQAHVCVCARPHTAYATLTLTS